MEPYVPAQALSAMWSVDARLRELAENPTDVELALISLAYDELKSGRNEYAVMFAFRNILEVPFATAVATVKIAKARIAAEAAALAAATAGPDASASA